MEIMSGSSVSKFFREMFADLGMATRVSFHKLEGVRSTRERYREVDSPIYVRDFHLTNLKDVICLVMTGSYIFDPLNCHVYKKYLYDSLGISTN